jgi:hypothetical protein
MHGDHFRALGVEAAGEALRSHDGELFALDHPEC